MVLNPAPALVRGRAAAESLMVDTCTIGRVVGQTTDPLTGAVTDQVSNYYAGKCRFQTIGRGSQARPQDAGEDYMMLLRIEVQLPISVTGVEVGDIITCETSVHDPDLPTRRFRVRDLYHKSHATARRVQAEEVT